MSHPRPRANIAARSTFVLFAALGLTVGMSVVITDPAAAASTAPSISVNHGVVLQRDAVHIAGRARGPVTIFRRTSGRWTKLTKVGERGGRYATNVYPLASTTTHYRAEANGRVSRSVTVRSIGCAPLAAHSGVQAWFNPRNSNRSQLVRNWAQLICSAARGATIDLPIRFVIPQAGSAADYLIEQLQLVAKYRGVHVYMLVRKSDYTRHLVASIPSWTSISHRLAFAHLTSCYYACRINSTLKADMHDKFMTVSSTIWGGPAVFETSANWSVQQLQRARQSGIYVYNNKPLYTAFADRFASLRACATGNCNAARATPVTLQSNGVLVDAHPVAWRGNSNGTSVEFDPQPVHVDPIAAELQSVRCEKGDQVMVASLRVTRTDVVTALNNLVQAGCAVRVLIEHTVYPKTVHYQLRCGYDHDKLIVIDAHHQSGAAFREVIQGSEDLWPSEVWQSDQQMVRTSAAGPYASYNTWYASLWRSGASCPST